MRQTTATVHLGLHEDPFPIRTLRLVLDDVGAHHGLSKEELFDLKVAATEALSNAVKGGRTDVDVAVEPRDGAIEVEVRNRGSFSLASSTLADIHSEGGRGIPLMFALVDAIELTSTSEGTRVRLSKRIRRGHPRETVAGGSSAR